MSVFLSTAKKNMCYNTDMCKTDKCSNKVRARGLCSKCWNLEQYGMCKNDCPTPATNLQGVCPNCVRRGGPPTRHNMGSVVNNDKQFWCTMCKEVRPIEDKSSHKNRCLGHQAQMRRESWLRRTYNITIEEYDRMAVGGCDSCGITNEKVLSVDHDHSCCAGAKSCGVCVRGVLCAACNSAAGHLYDDPLKANQLADYLRRTA